MCLYMLEVLHCVRFLPIQVPNQQMCSRFLLEQEVRCLYLLFDMMLGLNLLSMHHQHNQFQFRMFLTRRVQRIVRHLLFLLPLFHYIMCVDMNNMFHVQQIQQFHSLLPMPLVWHRPQHLQKQLLISNTSHRSDTQHLHEHTFLAFFSCCCKYLPHVCQHYPNNHYD